MKSRRTGTLRDRTRDFRVGDTFKFGKVTIIGPDVGDPEGMKGKTGQHSMGVYHLKHGAVRLDIPMDPFKEHGIASEAPATQADTPTPVQRACPYQYCRHDETKYDEPWKHYQNLEEEERKRQARARREERLKGEKP